MERVNFENVIKSSFLGVFIGVVLQFNVDGSVAWTDRLIMVLASGGMGFVIGLITEWLTLRLPINLANPRNYFFINNMIALVVTASIVSVAMVVTGTETRQNTEFAPILLVVLGIVCAANIMEYLAYRRTQTKLRTLKKMLKEQ